jgi:hypothetical protein
MSANEGRVFVCHGVPSGASPGSAAAHLAYQAFTEGDLTPDLGRRLGEHATKLEKQGVPRRYQRCCIHADLPCDCLDNNHIGLSACFLSL